MSRLKVHLRGRTLVASCWDCTPAHLVWVGFPGAMITLDHLADLEEAHTLARHANDMIELPNLLHDHVYEDDDGE